MNSPSRALLLSLTAAGMLVLTGCNRDAGHGHGPERDRPPRARGRAHHRLGHGGTGASTGSGSTGGGSMGSGSTGWQLGGGRSGSTGTQHGLGPWAAAARAPVSTGSGSGLVREARP